MVIAYIGLGANLGDCRANLLQAWEKLGDAKGVKLLELSSPYRSAPVGMDSENWFINAVGSLETSLEPFELLREMFVVEKSLGRKRILDGIPEDRVVDLDLLYWGDRVSTDSRVTLPHPEIAGRLFVLQPLADIGPDVRHPLTRKTSVEMLQELLAEEQAAGAGQQIYVTSWTGTEDEASQ